MAGEFELAANSLSIACDLKTLTRPVCDFANKDPGFSSLPNLPLNLSLEFVARYPMLALMEES
jgi:hypothetical protein